MLMPQNDAQKVQLTGAQATLLITLYAKAQDYRSRRPILNDAKADQLLGLIDYDFSQLPGFGSKSLLAIRARHLDDWIVEFIASQGDVVVLNLGCGLDTRMTRIGPPQSVRWFDLDYPDVIELRRKFYCDAEKYTMLGYPLSDSEWLRRVPHDRPTMIVADGVLEYLTEAEVGSLLSRLTSTFHHGQIAFDVMNSFAVRSGQRNLKAAMGAVHRWAVDDTSRVDALDAKLHRKDDLALFDSPYVRRLPWRLRLLFRAASLSRRYRDMIRLLRYEF